MVADRGLGSAGYGSDRKEETFTKIKTWLNFNFTNCIFFVCSACFFSYNICEMQKSLRLQLHERAKSIARAVETCAAIMMS